MLELFLDKQQSSTVSVHSFLKSCRDTEVVEFGTFVII